MLADKEYFSRLDGINGLGDEFIKNMIAYFSDDDNLFIVRQLQQIMTIQPLMIDKSKINEKFVGKSVIFTGTLQSMTRNQAKIQAELLGFKVLSSISGNTDYLVYGADAGSKLDKAKELGITILTEDEWKLLVE